MGKETAGGAIRGCTGVILDSTQAAANGELGHSTEDGAAVSGELIGAGRSGPWGYSFFTKSRFGS